MALSRAQLMPVSPVLTEHAGTIQPVGMIADQVFPPLMKVGAEKGQIKYYSYTNMTVPDDAQRAIGQEANRVATPEPSYADYTANVYAEKDLVTQRELDMASAGGNDPMELKFVTNKNLVNKVQLYREKNLADKLNT